EVIGRQVAQKLTKEIREELLAAFQKTHPATEYPEGMRSVIQYLESLAEHPGRQADLFWYEEPPAQPGIPADGKREKTGESTAQ
ncbi:MAG TPA: hypothetical protein PKV38_14630, partial [bacterium]|nr:hypothetical protein [bacterium]